MQTLASAWSALQAVLNKKDTLREEYEAKLVNLNELETKVRTFIRESSDNIPEVDFDPRVPFESWKVCASDLDRAVLAYRTIRDQVTANNSAATKFENETNMLKDIIGNWLLQKSNEQNVTSFRTEHGTAFRQLKVRASAANWDLFVKWASEHGAADALYKRVNSAFVKTYQEENSGEIPPYLNVDREYEIVVRKS